MLSRYRTLKTLSMLLSATLILFCIPLPSLAQEGGTVEKDSDQATLSTSEDGSLSLNCRSAVLMDAVSGTVLYTQNAGEALPPASVTKIMTLLLVMEAIDSGTLSLDDPISVSANAASMGGSQVYLEEGESMSCEDMLKSVVISSANDAAVALAEHIAGDTETFVRRMNEKAAALGMSATHFENATGLDDTATNHLTSAMDIAIMSRALIEHRTILQYSSIWMDTIRNGTFGLTNTNRLVRFYRGATGLKTGSTDKAGFCVSVTAERDGLSLICVIMGAENRDIRNAQATRLLDWGFANYAAYTMPAPKLPALSIVGGEKNSCMLSCDTYSCTVPKDQVSRITIKTNLPESVDAPIKKGDAIGKLCVCLDENEIYSMPICAAEDVPRVSFLTLWRQLLHGILLH